MTSRSLALALSLPLPFGGGREVAAAAGGLDGPAAEDEADWAFAVDRLTAARDGGGLAVEAEDAEEDGGGGGMEFCLARGADDVAGEGRDVPCPEEVADMGIELGGFEDDAEARDA